MLEGWVIGGQTHCCAVDECSLLGPKGVGDYCHDQLMIAAVLI
jgi:hypothetical protein